MIQEDKKKDKKEKIVEAAISVFARKGLERGKISDIAKEAGIGKGTIYEYFRSKEEIFSAIESTVMGEFINQLQRLFTSDKSPKEKLQMAMEQSIDAMITMGDGVLIVTELWAQGVRGHWHDKGESPLAKLYNRMRDDIISVLQSGIEAGEFRAMNKDGVATLLMAFLDGLGWQYMLLKDKKRFMKVKGEAIQSFMKGIQK